MSNTGGNCVNLLNSPLFRSLSYKINFRYYQNWNCFLIFAVQNRDDIVKILILSVILVALAVLLLGVKVLFVKGGKFPSGHVHDIPALRRHNISCAAHESRKEK